MSLKNSELSVRFLGGDHKAGAIAEDHLADFGTLDLGHPSLAFAPQESLEDALIFGGADGTIAEVCVGGRWLDV